LTTTDEGTDMLLNNPTVASIGSDNCNRCGRFTDCLLLTSSWTRAGWSFPVRQSYCWKCYRRLIESAAVVNEYHDDVVREIDAAEAHNPAPPAGPTVPQVLTAHLADDLVRAALPTYPARKFVLIKLIKERLGLGLVEAKKAIEDAYDRATTVLAPGMNGVPVRT
jgi:ribosomal protein L7/L12